ncbi:hypothetical protein [Pseudoalteromonas arabiensis]|uniref:hypothetical protein n=1 Tax=Pseudoalteromonas arabiensis TaxID=874454 RepID=UPI000782B365|nr:hypothetical protein [Pseudoalteromonas arabiensis]
MPINYEHDTDYANNSEEMQDVTDAVNAKVQITNKENVMDFDEFLLKEGISTNAIHSKDSK